MPQSIQPDPLYICDRKQAGACHRRECPVGKPRRYRDHMGPLRCTLTVPPVPGGVMVDEAVYTPRGPAAASALGKAGAA